MRSFRILLVVSALSLPSLSFAAVRYAVVTGPAPVFNIPDFHRFFGGSDGRTLLLDRCGQIRELEFVALPGTAVTVEGETESHGRRIARISTADYSSGKPLYVDARFLEMRSERPPERERRLPAREEILGRLLAAQGTPYVWGGNVRDGIPALLKLAPPSGKIGTEGEKTWRLAGLDCSGLLYEATGGFTPRNTSELVAFGRGIPISGLTAVKIAKVLRPLDLIVWRGHVIVVLDRDRTIESRLACGEAGNGGVIVRPLAARLREVMKTRLPADDDGDPLPPGKLKFVVRRWLD